MSARTEPRDSGGPFQGLPDELRSLFWKLRNWSFAALRADSDAMLASIVSKTMPKWWNLDFGDFVPAYQYGSGCLWDEWQRGDNAYFVNNKLPEPKTTTQKLYIYMLAAIALIFLALLVLVELSFLVLGVYYSTVVWICLVFGPFFGPYVIPLGLGLWFYLYFLLTFWLEKIPNQLFYWLDLLRGEAGQTGLANPFSDSIKYIFCLVFGDQHWHQRYMRWEKSLGKVQEKWTAFRVTGWHKKCFAFVYVAWWLRLTYRFLQRFVTLGYWVMMSFITFFMVVIQLNWTPLNTFCVAYQLVKVVFWIHKLAFAIAWIVIHCVKLCFIRRRRSVGAAEGDTIWLDLSPLKWAMLWFKIVRVNVVVKLLRFLKRIGFLVVVYSAKADDFKLRAVLTQGAMDLTQYINELDPPQFIRNFRLKRDQQLIDDTFDILREIGYPIEPDVKTQEPVMFDTAMRYSDWVASGTNFVTGLNPLKIFKGLEFNQVRDLAVPYKWSDEYINIQNELEATSRYFQDVDVSIPNFELAVDATWDMVKDIFKGSRITPFYMIYRNWKKNYNVGPFATSQKRPRNNLGFHVKMKRREDIGRFRNTRSYLKYWEDLYRNFPRMASFANVFYKSEALPPKKWSIGRVRTVVASYLPQYLWQMVFSFEPNHRLRPLKTPIKVGLPLTGFWLTQLFERHLHFKHHYAGDMSNFDSSISGNVMKAIKAIRAKGFENHRQVEMIRTMIDLNYDTIQNILLMTPSTGNLYKKGSGLTTGHASTSMDNSLTTVFLYMAAWVTLTGRTAADFKYFNELSCYGDDHLLSIHELAPRNWTFENVRKLMKTWGVDMRDEVEWLTKVDLKTGQKINIRPRKSTDLYALPFLSKYCRKPTAEDVADWKEAFGNTETPKVIVYHDPIGLLGKAAAGSKQKNVDYRLTRLHSYLQMSAFNRPTYDAIRKMAETVIRKYPKVPARLKKLPSFSEVNRKFMDPNTKLKDADGSDEEGDDASLSDLKDGVIVYGQMSVLDYLHNYLSVVPDVLNPSIQRIGYSVVTHKLIQPMLEWPKELIRCSNKPVTQGHFEKLIEQTPYKFLVNHSMPTLVTNEATLLVRHWLFLWLRRDDSALNLLGMLDKLLVKLSNLQFIINGKVSTKVTSFNFPVWNTLVLLMLNFVRLPDVHFEIDDDSWFSLPGLIMGTVLPDLSFYLNKVSAIVIAKIWHSVPPNFRELNFLTKPLKQGSWHYIMAGTGTGKSTSLIQFLDLYGPATWEKIIVVEPRSKVVTGLVGYMQGLGLNCSGATTGLKLDARTRVWYVTAQECFLHTDWLSEKNLIVIDEAHLDEEVYTLLFKYLKKKTNCTTFLLSATPREDQRVLVDSFTEVAIPKVYDTVQVDYPGHEIEVSIKRDSGRYWLLVYLNQVQNIMLTNRGFGRYLIFVNDKSDIDFFLTNLPGKGAGLSSSLELDNTVEYDYIVTTAVADVAITIPGVTHVITPNFKRSIEASGPLTTSPVYIPLDEGTIRQRKGRTGRTNNGWFYLLKFKFLEPNIIVEPTEKSHPMLIANWVLQGLPLEVLADVTPEVFDFRGPKGSGPVNRKLIQDMENAIREQNLVMEVLDKDLTTEDPSNTPIRVILKGDKTGMRKTMPIRSLRSHNMDDPPALYGYKIDLSNQLNGLMLFIANQFKMFGQGTNSAMWVNPQNLKPV
uniref:RNA-dependent RNA polymerase n=1 Tax=Neurospora crassa fusarivirus 1 TaxID=2715689 RepID=A0A7I8E612_9VIRU|nr:RNA-dependent RNA polymerase [Neurospora crassa fusarivirus 1]